MHGGQRSSKFPKDRLLYMKNLSKHKSKYYSTKWFCSQLTIQSFFLFFLLFPDVLLRYTVQSVSIWTVKHFSSSHCFGLTPAHWIWNERMTTRLNCWLSASRVFEGVHIHIGWRTVGLGIFIHAFSNQCRDNAAEQCFWNKCQSKSLRSNSCAGQVILLTAVQIRICKQIWNICLRTNALTCV